MDDDYEDGRNDDQNDGNYKAITKKSNVLPLWGNERTMNLNPLILTNIQSSHYFKVNLYELKTYHEVIDEIYFKVSHLEPWEKGSRKTAGQTGMCGGVRGVGAGGIVSTAFCLLYKLFTLKLSRKQVIGLITHPDSPYIRVLGFMYIRYTQPPADLWDWYEEYLDDPEELDVKAGGGQVMAIGNILKNFLCKLEWFSTLFPRIPVPIQQKLERKMNERYPPVGPVPKGLGGSAVSWNRSDDYSRSDRSHSKSARSPEKTDRHAYRGDDYRSSREDSRRRSNEDRRYENRHGRSQDRSIDYRSAEYNSGRSSRSGDSKYIDDDRYRRRETNRDDRGGGGARSKESRRKDEEIYGDGGVSSASRRSDSRKRHYNDDAEYVDNQRKRDHRDNDVRIRKKKHHKDHKDHKNRRSSEERRGRSKDKEYDDYHEERKHRREIDDIIRHHSEKIRRKSSNEDVDGKYVSSDERYDDYKKYDRRRKNRDYSP